jgi:N-acetylglucosamine-6-sulfatase
VVKRPGVTRGRIAIAALLAIGVLVPVGIMARSRDRGTNDSSPSASTPGSVRPNIVLILTDDQRWDSLWAMPNVRRLLGDHGVQFTNSFVVNPLCCPSRASILTGRYSHGTGVYTNLPAHGGFQAFDPTTTIATVLQTNGYRTALIGKYLNGYRQLDVPPGWDRWAAFNAPTGGVSYFDYTMSEDGVERRYGAAPNQYSTDVLAGQAVSFIRETHRPFFLYFSTSAPHPPAVPAPRDAHARLPAVESIPPSYNEPDTSDKPAWVRALPPFDSARIDSVDRRRDSQLRSLLAVDDAVKRIVDTLRSAGVLRRTLIVFMSDNGLMYGEHRLDGKQVPYEESIRVPLVLRYDPLTGEAGKDARMALNIDLAPTFADAAGVRMPGADGRSLLSLIRNPSAPGRGWFLIEHERMDSGPPLEGIPTYCAVRSQRWKYVYYDGGDEELYDLAKDPFELLNVAGDPSAPEALGRAKTELARLCNPPPPGLTLP